MIVEQLAPKAKAAVALDPHRIKIYEGSVRSGKTIGSLIEWITFTRRAPAGNLVMVGKTERTLKRNIIDPLIDMLGPKRCRYVQGSGELWLLGRRIYIAGANDERAQDKIRGLTLLGAYVDELTIIPESFFRMLLTRLSLPGARCIATTNPDGPRHWAKVGFLDRARTWIRHDGTTQVTDTDLDLARISFRLADNPTLDQAYIAALEAEFTGLWHQRFIEGLWVLAEGVIYQTVPTVADVGDTTGWEWTVAVDYGTRNPFAAVLLGLDRDRGRIVAVDEWRWDSQTQRRQLTDAEYSVHLRSWLTGLDARHPGAARPHRIYVDPSAASFVTQLYRDGWSGVHRADNAVLDGIRATSTLLARQLLVVAETCTGLLTEAAEYSWDPKAAKAGEDRPLKINDHSMDALRYGVMGTTGWWRHWMLAP